MIETRTNRKVVERAFVVGVHFGSGDSTESEHLLAEMCDLATSFGLHIAESQLVRSREPHPKFLTGTGKAEELSARAKELDADVIIFDNPLTPAQQRNWEKQASLAVIDREEVILEIFAKRAQTREARLQIGLALMEYSLPRLTRAWGHLGRQGGALGAKGEGETQLEIDRRIVRKRIEKFREELTQVRLQRSTQRKQRQRRPAPSAAIVGYTNAGKSSLLRHLTGAHVLVEDKLFATLDTTTRKIRLPSGQPLLLTDTVGFVRKLPHRLVESFKATLEEAAEADFLIHVLDSTSPQVIDFWETTRAVLSELGAGDKPSVTVLNKSDLLTCETQQALLRHHFPDAVMLSSLTGEGTDRLMDALGTLLEPSVQRLSLQIPPARYDIVSLIHREGRVLEEEYSHDTCRIMAELPKRFAAMLRPFEIPK